MKEGLLYCHPESFDVAPAVAVVERASEMLLGLGDELGLARAAYLMSDLTWLMGDPVASYADAERMLSHARRAGSGFDDPDLEQIIEAVGVQFVCADTLDDPPDGAPVDPDQPGDRGLVGAARQPRHELLEVAREVRAVAGERHRLGPHAVGRANQPAQPDAELQAPDTEIEMTPDRIDRPDVVAMGRGELAQRTDEAPAAQRDPHDHAVGLEPNVADTHPFQAQQTTECGGDAHGTIDLPVRRLRHPRAYGRPVRVSRSPSHPCKAPAQAPKRAPTSPTSRAGAPEYPVIGGFNRAGGQQPGAAAIDSHGSMCAADIAVAAPDAKLYDYPFLVPRSSSALAMFNAVLEQRRQDGTPHVVSNSWGFVAVPPRGQDPTNEIWDLDHPLHRKIREVITSGAPVLFAAGNCGEPCPSGNCDQSSIGPGQSIHGSNSLEEVITVAAANNTGERIGYSSQGPGMFAPEKPDVAAYSHFFGNFGPGRPGGDIANPFDNGTSAACSVAAGVVALLLSAFPNATPSALRDALIEGAGNADWSPETGRGVIHAAESMTDMGAAAAA